MFVGERQDSPLSDGCCPPAVQREDYPRPKQGAVGLTCRTRPVPWPDVTARSDRLCREIETGALDHQTPVSDVLRKAITLGSRAGSTELRDWAMRELQGYGPDDELPEYRKIAAPLQVDMINPVVAVKRHTISPMELPDFA
jgi:hypothetical protein